MAHQAYKEAQTPRTKGKRLSHLEVVPSANGGTIIRHHFANDGMEYHKAEEHTFGKDEGAEVMAHIAKNAHISAASDEDEA